MCMAQKSSVKTIEVLKTWTHEDGHVKDAKQRMHPRYSGAVVFEVTVEEFMDSPPLRFLCLHFHHTTAKC